MRTAIFTSLFAVFGYVANAQLNLIPQVGVEDFRTSVKYNGQSPASGVCLKPAAQAALRLEYLFKKNHGPWIAAATTRSMLEYTFADPENGRNVFQTAAGNTQFRLEGGYQLKSKRLFFKKSASEAKTSSYAGHCRQKMMESRCGSKSQQAKTSPVAKGTWMRLVPSVGLAYVPGAPESSISAKTSGAQTLYTYNAGNWRTAMLGGLGIEFGKNQRQLFSLSLNYLSAFGDGLDAEKITTVEGNKTTNTTLSSNSSAWNFRLGVPFSLLKRKTVKEVVVKEVFIREIKKCGETKMQFKPRCNKTYIDQ